MKLQSRISELHLEIDTAKEDFRLLHKERTLLTKERENQEKDIQIWSARCRELQMLKFGKLVDLDELEAKSDRTKEIEAESALTEDAEKFRSSSLTIIKSIKQLEEQLIHVSMIVMMMMMVIIMLLIMMMMMLIIVMMMMMMTLMILIGGDSGRSDVDLCL